MWPAVDLPAVDSRISRDFYSSNYITSVGPSMNPLALIAGALIPCVKLPAALPFPQPRDDETPQDRAAVGDSGMQFVRPG